MSSEGPEQPEGTPSPAPETETQPEPAPEAQPREEGVWKEDYDDVIEPSEEEKAAAETPKVKPKKKRHLVGIITLIVVIVFLLLWTLLSPKVMPTQGTTYVDSHKYASLGNYTGTRDIWSGNVAWGFSVSLSNNTTSAGTPIEFQVLVTKISERPGNFFFRGLAITIENCSLWDGNGTFIAKMTSSKDLGFGKMAIMTASLPRGSYSDLYVSMKFTEYEVMRIGYVPLENVLVEKISLEQLVVA